MTHATLSDATLLARVDQDDQDPSRFPPEDSGPYVQLRGNETKTDPSANNHYYRRNGVRKPQFFMAQIDEV